MKIVKALSKQLFGAKYESVRKGMLAAVILFVAVYAAELSLKIAPFILYLTSTFFTAGIMWQIIEIRELLLTLNQTCGITIIISSHILSELEHIATHYGFLHNGKLLREISASDIPHSSDGLECFYKTMLEDRK